jgi:hypothetical protein
MEILFHGSVVVAARTNARGGENGGNGRGVKVFGRMISSLALGMMNRKGAKAQNFLTK